MALYIIALLALVPAQAQAGDLTGSSGDDPSVDAQDLSLRAANAVGFRADFGFPVDAGTVSALLSDPSSDYSFGAPLSPKELANMNARLELREQAEPAVAYIDSHPDDFGGLYFTQNTGQLVMVILPVEEIAPKLLDEAIALIPGGLTTQFLSVKHSTSELEKARERLAARWDDLQINALGIRVPENDIDLVLESSAMNSRAADVAGAPVAVTVGPGPEDAVCNNSSSCRPYRGGIGIFSPQANEFCTWGFYGDRGTASKYLITAGHCAKLGHTETHEFDGSGNRIVVTDGVDRNTFDGNGTDTSDAMTAHVKASGFAVSPFNTIYASAVDKAHAILATKFTTQKSGDAVCFMGGATGTSLCGKIEATGLAYDLKREADGKVLRLTGQVQMSRVAKVGDSGGPVYQGNTAWGIVNALANGNSHMLYSTIANVQTDVGTSVCVLSGC